MLKWIGLSLLTLLIASVVATLWKVEQRKATAKSDFPPDGEFTEVDGHPVHYVSMGAADRPAVVLLHGASGNTRDFTFDLARRLASDYRVVVFDRPGLGHTPALAPNGVTISDQAALLSKASANIGVLNPIVAGQSFGGAVTMAWAVNHPDNIAAAVSIAGATYPWEGGFSGFYARLADPWKGPVVARLISAWASEDYVADSIAGIFAPQPAPDGYAAYVGVPLVLRPSSLLANAQQRHELRPQLAALAPQYKNLTLPVEIVHGDKDTTVGINVHSTRMVEDIPGANLVALEGIGHMPHHTNPEDVIAAIDRAAVRAGLR
ncbi:pimeloyl-ACP methyl ester carboxylesterase [Shimia isoporae]|uniref:Pimeloyl-ACP methyl ester carboxylesterase n=1 Tax=Shimia isoporae TaxID=647720 RepID=A0A4R1NVJ5_9RHOB|nr:alpha/beta hydrolase [Shimia isoporae]TCL09298.1 pimeloyl-ACP methyl ester carboxylesterase [Shimia isoporae]